jgi:Protein of unknown function (DUF1018)
MTATARQIGAIHAIAKSLRLDDDVRRDLMERETGKRSAALLSEAEAGRVIETLKGLSSTVQTVAGAVSNGAVRLDGPYAGKLRALWISGWNLGVVRERSDKALLAFIERQTGVSHPRFLREPREGAKAIEGLKAWLARNAGVAWPGPHASPADVKRAVIIAQCKRLGFDPVMHQGCDDSALDFAASALGRKLRRKLAASLREVGDAA